MDDPLFQALTHLANALAILARERDLLAVALARLTTDVKYLQGEVSVLREQVAVQVAAQSPPYASLASETREHVDTACAAYHLGRKVQTLRKWACYENGPVRPVRIHGRLAWPVSELRRLGCR